MKIKTVVAYHSGFGHTAKVALAIEEGLKTHPDVMNKIINVEKMLEEDWNSLDEADAIIFGAPTYMGGVSAKFKEFIDNASKRWFIQKWHNKIAAGFTNSGSYSGDKLNSLFQLVINAMQHSMIWVGTGIMPTQKTGNESRTPDDINRLGSYLGLATQSNNDSPEVTPPKGDLETARLFGKRIADITFQFKRGAL